MNDKANSRVGAAAWGVHQSQASQQQLSTAHQCQREARDRTAPLRGVSAGVWGGASGWRGIGQAGQRRGSRGRWFVNDHRWLPPPPPRRGAARFVVTLKCHRSGWKKPKTSCRWQGRPTDQQHKDGCLVARCCCFLAWQPTDPKQASCYPAHRQRRRSFLYSVLFLLLLSWLADGPLFDLLFGSLFCAALPPASAPRSCTHHRARNAPPHTSCEGINVASFILEKKVLELQIASKIT